MLVLAAEGLETLQDRYAGIAQLVERQLPKLNVEGSNPFARFVGDGWRGCGGGSVERYGAGAKSVPCWDADG